MCQSDITKPKKKRAQKGSKSHTVQICFCVPRPCPTRLALSLAERENTMEWWRDSFARAAFAATQLAAEQWAHQISKWHSTGRPSWSVALNGVGQFGRWLHWRVRPVIVLPGSRQMGEKHAQVLRGEVTDGVIIIIIISVLIFIHDWN